MYYFLYIKQKIIRMDLTKLKGHVPDSVIADIPFIMEKYQINTPARLAHFLGQAGHESGNFKVVKENLNYSADRLKVIFPKYFKDKDTASYNRNPEKIANLVYGNRMGNGDEKSGEGYKYHGRGFIQLTGKDNYKSFGTSIGEDLVANPELVATKYSLISAAWFFSKNCLKKSDAGVTKEAITAVTKSVNGGTIGLDDRIKHTLQFYKLLA